MKAKRLRRAVVLSVLALALCVGLLAGTTFAWFTDTVSSTGNTIVAGELEIGLSYTEDGSAWTAVEEDTALFDADALWEPGYMDVAYLKVENTGSLALSYDLYLSATDTVQPQSVLGDPIALSEYVQYALIALEADENGNITPYADRAAADAALAAAEVRPFGELCVEGAVLYPASAEQAAADYYALLVFMPETVGNEANAAPGEEAASLAIAVNLFATQTPYEEDGFGDDGYDDAEKRTGVTIRGIAGLEGQLFESVDEAYEAGNAVLAAAGDDLGQGVLTDEQFDAVYTDGGRITWTIYGIQEMEDDARVLTFGRAANRYSSTRSVSELCVVGGNESAELCVNSIGLPYAWWSDAKDELTVRIEGVRLTMDNAENSLSCSRAFGAPLNVYFEDCAFTGRLYHYFNGEGVISVTNCTFENDGSVGYAFFVQGSETDPLQVTFSGNTVTGYSRGINIQQATAVVTIANNTITGENSEPDRGALQLTDAATVVVSGNTIDVNAGNAIWFHDAATNADVQYTFTDNVIRAPYLINDDTTFGIDGHITSSGNTVEVEFPGMCMEKEASEASASNVTLN